MKSLTLAKASEEKCRCSQQGAEDVAKIKVTDSASASIEERACPASGQENQNLRKIKSDSVGNAKTRLDARDAMPRGFRSHPDFQQ